jgi:tetratricopeptide (TPR) repeat protein
MKRISRLAAAICSISIASSAVPALAQYANEFTPAKVNKQGNTAHDIAGSGTVKVQVQVNPDGTHKVMKVISSSNPADNAAAMDIAQSSTYVPAHRGSTPVTSFYDYVLKFNGKYVVPQSPEQQTVAAGGADAAAIDALIRGGKYKDAIAKANASLVSSPGNPAVMQLLGVAQYYDGDIPESAATFSRVDDIKKPFAGIAAVALASGAVKVASTDPTASMQYAQKANTLSQNASSKFALGVAQLANKQYSDAIASLRAVHDQVTDTKARLNIDQELLQAYLSTNDTADANATANEMKTLDPNGGQAAQEAMARHYLQAGSDAMNAKDFPGALKYFDQAAASGSPSDAVTANTFAAFAILRMDKPDFNKAKGYAMKAVTAAPDDPQANYAAGIAYAGIYSSSQNKDDKTQALNYLKKSDQLAKAAGNEALALQVEAQIKNIPQ